MDPVEKPAEEAQKTDQPASQTLSTSVREAESPKPAEGSPPAAVPDGAKGLDLENKVKGFEGVLKASQRENTELKSRLGALETDLGDALEALSKVGQTTEPPEDGEPKPGARPNALSGIMDRRKAREAEAKAKAATGSASATVRFVALVEGAGLSLDDPRLAEARAAATPEEGYEKAKAVINGIRETDRKAADDRYNTLADQVKELRNGMLRVDTSAPTGGVVPQGDPFSLAVQAYSGEPKR